MYRLLTTLYQEKALPPDALTQPGQSNAAPWIYSWSEPVRFKRDKRADIALIASGMFAPVFDAGNLPGASYVPWIYPWSEPVRFKRDKREDIALIASGEFGPVQFEGIHPGPTLIPWIYSWSEPVRFKRDRREDIALIASGDYSPVFFDGMDGFKRIPWYMALSEPRRFKKGLGAQYQQFDPYQTPIQPVVSTLIQWYANLSEPVRIKPGLKVYLQSFYTSPERVLPTPDVTVTMSATEINDDMAIFAVNVYNSVGPVTSGAGARVAIVEVVAGADAASSIRES